MALYEHQNARLGAIEGTGYLFRKKTVFGEEYKGVFITPEENAEDLVALKDQETVMYSGVAYKKNRSGDVTKEKVEYPVDVTSLSSVAMGERALLEVIEEEE